MWPKNVTILSSVTMLWGVITLATVILSSVASAAFSYFFILVCSQVSPTIWFVKAKVNFFLKYCIWPHLQSRRSKNRGYRRSKRKFESYNNMLRVSIQRQVWGSEDVTINKYKKLTQVGALVACRDLTNTKAHSALFVCRLQKFNSYSNLSSTLYLTTFHW